MSTTMSTYHLQINGSTNARWYRNGWLTEPHLAA
jgi:hypothetical protein